MMAIFVTVFSSLAKMPSEGVPYALFAYCALLPWTFFANALSSSAGSVVGSANLISKVYFPRLIVPLSSIGSWLVDFAIATVILLGMMLYYGIGWTTNLFGRITEVLTPMAIGALSLYLGIPNSIAVVAIGPIVGAALVLRLAPETRGMTLEQIADALGDRRTRA